MDKQEFLPENLRILSERAGTVTDLCRRIGINRQQFNKYLAGTHAPSRTNLRAIAGFFGLNEEVLFSAPNDFRSMMDGGHFHLFRSLVQSPAMQLFIGEMLRAGGAAEFAGIYERYHYSSIYPGQILRSIFCLYERDGVLMHYYVERFPSLDGTGKVDYRFKYHGLSFLLAGRIFSVDFETIQKNEMTFSNLAAVNRSSRKYIFGVTSGIAATMMRQPVAAKVAMCFVAKGLIRKEHMRRATVLEPGDPSIPREVLNYLNSGNTSIDSA